MVEPGGVFNYLDRNGHSAVDHLQNLSERLDDPSLVDLMGTCHALRDGEFSRTAPTAAEPTGRQVLRDAVDARRAIRVDELAQELDAGPEGLEGLLRSEAPIDCKRKNLKRRDVCLLAGLCVCDAASVRATGIRLDGGFLPLQDVLGGAQSLDLRNTALGDLSILFLAKCLRFNTVLRSVNLAGNDIGDEGASKLAAVLKETKIEELKLDDNQLGPEGGVALAEGLKGNSTLQSLSLSNNILCLDENYKFTAMGITKLCEGLKGSTVTLLDLAYNQICGLDGYGNGTYTAKGITKLCEALKESAVTSLNLAGNALCGLYYDVYDTLQGTYTKKGITKLCDGLKGSAVTSLDLKFNNLGPKGGAALAEGLKGNSTLQSLDLANNELCGLDFMGSGTYTAEGITKLCEGLKGSAVTSLNLRYNNLNKDAKKALRDLRDAAGSDIKIEF